MTIRQLYGHSLALGLSWLPPDQVTPGRSKSRMMRELLKQKPQPACYAEMNLSWGTQVAVTGDTAAAGRVAAAAWLASAQKSAVLVEELGDNEYWFCAIEDGVVFPAGDLVGDRDRISARITELRSDMAATKIPCYEKDGSFQLPDASPLDFSDLTAGTDPDPDWTVLPLQSKRSRKPLLGIAAAVCIAAGYGAWHFYSLSTQAPAVPAATESALQQSQRAQERSMLTQLLAQQPGQLVNAIAREITVRPHRTAGWRNISAEWKLDAVQTQWERAHGSYSSLAAHLDSRQFTLDEKTGVVTEQYPMPAPMADDIDLDSQLASAPDRYALLDALADIPGKWTLASSSQTGTEYPVRVSAITGEATGFDAAKAAARFFSGHPVHIRSISVQLNPRPTWRFAGDYYAPSN